MLIPLVRFDRIDEDRANHLLVRWQHKMGPCNRPFPTTAHALFHEDVPVCVVMHGPLITPSVGGEQYNSVLRRDACVEVCRLCAERPHLNRVGLRLWREFVLPSLGRFGVSYAISYQDADIHTGNIYRFDGWQRFHYSHSGTDTRTGKAGRRKWLWIYPPLNVPVS